MNDQLHSPSRAPLRVTPRPWIRALREPQRALRVLVALLHGHWCRVMCRLRGVRFRAGRNLRVFGRLKVRGPGEVVFGDNVVINGTVTPWTYAPEARIVVGSHVIMGGTQFGCAREITVGDHSLLAEASIMDTDFHSIGADRRTEGAYVRSAPVHLGRNVWISRWAGILPGTTIGENSVVGFGAVCMRSYPENVVLLGNPAKVAAPVPRTSCPSPEATVAAGVEALKTPGRDRGPGPRATLMSILFSLLLVSGLYTACSSDSMEQTTSATATSNSAPRSAKLAEVSASEWQHLASRRIFFGHQSVGQNIIDGVRALLAEHPEIPLRLRTTSNPASVAGPALIEANIGRNREPATKDAAFAAALEEGMDAPGSVAMYKYCYLDIQAQTDVAQLFQAYRSNIEAVRAKHPGLTIVHSTLPLTTTQDRGLKWLAKRLLGRATDRDLNAKRNQFNRLLVQSYGGKDPIFDLSSLESTRADGTRSYFVRGRDTVYTLAPEWTMDGGHLNEAAQRRVAESYLVFLAHLP